LSSSSNNDIKLDHHHSQKGGTNESIEQWNINGLRNNFEELKILPEELGRTIVCLQETNVKPEQQKILVEMKSSRGTNGIKVRRLELKTKLNAIAARIEMKRTINICSLCIPS
jgi:exonuclease III